MNAMLPEGVVVQSVGELVDQVKLTLEGTFPKAWVAGEISNLSRPASGHVYLTLKDVSSQLRAVIYRGVAMRMRFEPRDGTEVIARGKLSVYVPRGEYQLIIEELIPKGIGALELALQQLREKLFRKGYFEPNRKKPLPRFPGTVALVTSATGAAVRDMLEMFGRRWPATRVVVCPVRVQGEGSAEEIAAMITLLNQLHQRGLLAIDAMIVGRGGGSLEDLWAFNEEPVADALFASRIVTISAVGHETDVTIADHVADHRALTPTHGVASLTPDRQEWLASLAECGRRMHEALRRRTLQARQRLEQLQNQRALRLPLERIQEQARRLDEVGERTRRALQQRLDARRRQLDALAGRLHGLSPLQVLSRGYTLTFGPDGSTLLRKATAVQVGQSLTTRLESGQIRSTVTAVEPAPLDPVTE